MIFVNNIDLLLLWIVLNAMCNVEDIFLLSEPNINWQIIL
jgi:hypothetical protein